MKLPNRLVTPSPTRITRPPMPTPLSSSRIALIIAAAYFMLLLDGAILNTSLPLMAANLGVTPLALTSGVTVYLLCSAAIIPASGWIGDRFEARRVFMLAMAGFTAASMACGLAQSLNQLVVARAAQGLAAGLMSPLGRTIVMRHAPKSEVMRAIALITWPALLAPVLGPPLGGFISTYASWRWNFFINLPIGLLGLLAVVRWVPRIDAPRPGKLDAWGCLLSATTLVLLLAGLEHAALGVPQRGGDAAAALAVPGASMTAAAAADHAAAQAAAQAANPAADPAAASATAAAPATAAAVSQWLALGAWAEAAALLAGGLVVGVLAVRHLRRTPHPVVSLAPLSVRTFSVATLAGGTSFMLALQATPFLLPVMFQLAFGMSAVQAGLFTLAYFLGNLTIKPATTPLLRRFGFRRVMQVGGVLAALAIAGCALLQAQTPAAPMALLLWVAGATRSMQMTALNTLAFADISPAQRSAAATLSTVSAQLASALGVALGTLMLALSQRAHGRTALAAPDFAVAFVGMACVAGLSTLAFSRLRPDDGAEVSGHRAAATG